MKRKAGIIILICSLLALAGILAFVDGTETLDKLMVSESAYEEIKHGREPMEISKIDLKLNGISCVYSPSTETFLYSLKEGSSSAKNPSVSVKADLKLAKIAFAGEGISEESLKNAEEMKVIVYTNSGYHEYKLASTTLPILCIDTKKAISDEYCKMNMTLYDNREYSFNSIIKSEGDVRIRGAMSKNFPKTGLKLSLTKRSVGNNKRNNDLSLLGMRQDDDWILYALYNDQEKVRTVFCQNLWKDSCGADNELGIDIGPEFKFVEVFINDEYYGLCGLGTPIDEQTYNYKGGDTQKEALFQSTMYADLSYNYMREGGVWGYELKSGKTIYTDELIDSYDWDLLLEYIYQFEENKFNNEELFKGIDLDNALDFTMFVNLIQGQDTTYGPKIRNYYLGLTKDKEDNIKILYDPWDMDISWGNEWDGNWDHNSTQVYSASPEMNYLVETGYLDQIMRNGSEYLREKMNEKYKELRAAGWSDENILSLIDEYEAQIYGSGAYIRDCRRWPDTTCQDPELGLSVFREYVLNRLEEMDLYMDRLYKEFTSPILIRKSTAYKHFNDSPLLMVFNDSSYLFDSDFQDLFDYMGIDTDTLDTSVKAILYNGSKEKKYELLYEFGGAGFKYHSELADIEITRVDGEDYYSAQDGSVFLDGAYCYDTISEYEPAVRFYNAYNGISDQVDYSKNNDFNLVLLTVDDMILYSKALRMFNCNVTVTASNKDFLKDARIDDAFKLIEDRITYVDGLEDNQVMFEVTDCDSGKRIDKVLFTYFVKKDGNRADVKTKTATRNFE